MLSGMDTILVIGPAGLGAMHPLGSALLHPSRCMETDDPPKTNQRDIIHVLCSSLRAQHILCN
jgi:hypothetical protein